MLLSPSLISDTEPFIFAAVAWRQRGCEGLRPGQAIDWKLDQGIVNGRSGSAKGQAVVLAREKWHGIAVLYVKGMQRGVPLC